MKHRGTEDKEKAVIESGICLRFDSRRDTVAALGPAPETGCREIPAIPSVTC